MTELLFRADPYLRDCDARVVAVNERGGVILDRTVFYATAGGQPGDAGTLEVPGLGALPIATTVYDDGKRVVHVVEGGGSSSLPEPGAEARAALDWERRYRHMRAHTALHLLCALVKFPVTGGQIAADGGRLDFDIADPSAVSREMLESEINRLIAEDHPVAEQWISDADLAANPGLVRTMSVKPPTGTGQVRLVAIGEGGGIDLQPCGGTHVRRTGEIGRVTVAKPESKGRQNRRIRLNLA
jgi:misacylated tRNA(Ala) deacylase